jgi:hypothetical protein
MPPACFLSKSISKGIKIPRSVRTVRGIEEHGHRLVFNMFYIKFIFLFIYIKEIENNHLYV